MATDPVDAEPTLSSTAMHVGMTKEGSGFPDEREQWAVAGQINRACAQVQSMACLRNQASYTPFHCP